MTLKRKNIINSIFVVFLVLALCSSAFAYPVTMNIGSNVNGFKTNVFLCSDKSCQSLVPQLWPITVTSSANSYTVSSGQSDPREYTLLELNYAAGYAPWILARTFDNTTGSGGSGIFNLDINFAKRNQCTSRLFDAKLLGSSVEEGGVLSTNATAKSPVNWPSAFQPNGVALPDSVKDAYSPEVSIIAVTPTKNISLGSTKILINSIKTFNTSGIVTLPNGTYPVKLGSKPTDSMCDQTAYTWVGENQFNLTVTDASPKVSITSPTAVNVGVPANFTANIFSPVDAITSVAWSFSDGATATGNATNHRFASAGTFTVTVTVMDSDGSKTTAVAAVDVTDRADISVESLSISKANTTIFIGDNVTVTANVSNNGPINQSVKLNVKDNGVVVSSKAVALSAGSSQVVDLEWLPVSDGTRFVTLEAEPLKGEANVANNHKSVSVVVASVKKNIQLEFVNANSPPATATKSTTVDVWVRVTSSSQQTLKDLKVTLDPTTLAVNTNQDGNNQTTKTYPAFTTGSRTFFWKLNAGSANSANDIKVSVGTGADKVTITRNVAVS